MDKAKPFISAPKENKKKNKEARGIQCPCKQGKTYPQARNIDLCDSAHALTLTILDCVSAGDNLSCA